MVHGKKFHLVVPYVITFKHYCVIEMKILKFHQT